MKPTLWVDQFGNKFYASTRKELVVKVGGGRVSKMYVDGKDGKAKHIGYVIGQHWLTGYVQWEGKGE